MFDETPSQEQSTNNSISKLELLGMIFLAKIAKDLYQIGTSGITKALEKDFYRLATQVPLIKNMIEKDTKPAIQKIQAEVLADRDGEKFNNFPENGHPLQDLVEELKNLTAKVPANKLYKVSGSVYWDLEDKEFEGLMREVHKYSNRTNPLHPDVWPKLLEMAAQVVNSCQQIMQHPNPKQGFGWIAPGGSYAIYEAIKAYKIKYEEERNSIQNILGYFLPPLKYKNTIISSGKPNIVAPSTVHAAFEKACENFGIDLIKVPVHHKTQQADVKAMQAKITSSTLCLVGGGGSYAAGAIDDMQALSKIAQENNIGLHLDSCLGGFVAPFIADQTKTPFDFKHIPGLTSITMCTHKQAGGDKGSSVVLYRDYEKLGKFQVDTRLKSEIGVYATPGMGGSSSGFAIASAWAAMFYNGRQGYKEVATKIHNIVKQINEEVAKIPELRIHGTNHTNVFSITSDEIPIHIISEELHKLGWHLNDLPKGFHFCVTGVHINHEGFAKEFISDLKTSVANAKERLKINPEEQAKSGNGALYGTMSKIPPGFTPAMDDPARKYYHVQWSTERVVPEEVTTTAPKCAAVATPK
jgi:sphinganine-1-phosphate aldolase